jgi:hypothetical protein
MTVKTFVLSCACAVAALGAVSDAGIIGQAGNRAVERLLRQCLAPPDGRCLIVTTMQIAVLALAGGTTLRRSRAMPRTTTQPQPAP